MYWHKYLGFQVLGADLIEASRDKIPQKHISHEYMVNTFLWQVN